jgi:hypothetical protein
MNRAKRLSRLVGRPALNSGRERGGKLTKKKQKPARVTPEPRLPIKSVRPTGKSRSNAEPLAPQTPKVIDLSDLSAAAQARIQADEIEAERFLAKGKVLSETLEIRKKLPWANARAEKEAKRNAITIEQLLPIVALDNQRVARFRAAQCVMAGVADEYLKTGGLDKVPKVRSIGEQICARYGCSSGWLDEFMRQFRIAALRNKAAHLEAAKSPDLPARASDIPAEGSQAVLESGQSPANPQTEVRRKAHEIPTTTESCEKLKAKREQLLNTAQERWLKLPTAGKLVPFAWIYAAAHVDRHDAYNWKNGKLPDRSKMSQSIERVLGLPHPPVNPKPDSH